MPSNKNLHKAKDAKNDEFYTQREDIERELSHYKDFFKDKVVYCNCDDPVESEFWKFFVRVYKDWGLKKLMATHYEPDEKNFAYKLEISEDTNGDGRVDMNDEPTITQIQCNGDFRSQICIDMLQEADIVVTNPPFSLFREYIMQLIEYDKKFLIIGHQNAIKYREIFPLIRANKLWLGYGFPGNVGFFRAPHYEDYAVSSQHKEGLIRVSGVMWFTNLDTTKRHQEMDLRGNYYKAENYPHFANFNAIEVKKTEDIPCDFDGVMGVPITFMQSYNPEQFELLGRTGDIEWATSDDCDFFTPPSEEQRKIFKTQNKTWRVQNGYHVDENGIAHTVYDRLFVRLKHPEPRRYPDDN